MTVLRNKLNLDLVKRPRRMRTSAAMRELVSETFLQPKDFIAPFFVVPGKEEVQPIGALPRRVAF